MPSKINGLALHVPIDAHLPKLTCLSDSDVYKAATMDFSPLLLPSCLAIMAATSSTVYSSANLVEFIARFPNCLIATYTIDLKPT